MLTKEQAIDILERFAMFQGQRAGRELWNDKPFNVQEKDIADFSRDIALLKEYINGSVPKSALEGLATVAQRNIDSANERAEKFCAESEKTRVLYENARSNVAREIFDEIDKLHIHVSSPYDANRYAELKKKYTEGKK